MAKLIDAAKRRLPSQRKLVQLYAALLYNCHIKGFIKGDIYTGKLKALCVPGLNCYSCPGAIGACPLGALQNAIASSGSRAPTYILGILMLYGLILGRTICGWLCPMGWIQELAHKIPTPKLKKSPATRGLTLLKYFLLFALVIIIPYWYSKQSLPLPAFCKYICPAGTLEGAVGLLANPKNADKFSMLGILFTRKFVILIALLCLCVFVYRAFCRFICPLGAIYSLFSRFQIIGVKVEAPKCTDCGKCVSFCKMDVRRVGDRECIHCGECLSVCPTGAISFKAGKITLMDNETVKKPTVNEGSNSKSSNKRKYTRLAAWILALLLLVCVAVYVNRPDKPKALAVQASEITGESESAVPVGPNVGDMAADFIAPLYGGGKFALNDYRGKIVVINFWATWCTPCCLELPNFDRAYLECGDVAMIALHSNIVTDDVDKYLSLYDYTLPFGLDSDGKIIASFGGSTMLPQTVVLDSSGIITYNSVGSMTYEKLMSLIEEARKS